MTESVRSGAVRLACGCCRCAASTAPAGAGAPSSALRFASPARRSGRTAGAAAAAELEVEGGQRDRRRRPRRASRSARARSRPRARPRSERRLLGRRRCPTLPASGRSISRKSSSAATPKTAVAVAAGLEPLDERRSSRRRACRARARGSPRSGGRSCLSPSVVSRRPRGAKVSVNSEPIRIRAPPMIASGRSRSRVIALRWRQALMCRPATGPCRARGRRAARARRRALRRAAWPGPGVAARASNPLRSAPRRRRPARRSRRAGPRWRRRRRRRSRRRRAPFGAVDEEADGSPATRTAEATRRRAPGAASAAARAARRSRSRAGISSQGPWASRGVCDVELVGRHGVRHLGVARLADLDAAVVDELGDDQADAAATVTRKTARRGSRDWSGGRGRREDPATAPIDRRSRRSASAARTGRPRRPASAAATRPAPAPIACDQRAAAAPARARAYARPPLSQRRARGRRAGPGPAVRPVPCAAGRGAPPARPAFASLGPARFAFAAGFASRLRLRFGRRLSFAFASERPLSEDPRGRRRASGGPCDAPPRAAFAALCASGRGSSLCYHRRSLRHGTRAWKRLAAVDRLRPMDSRST